MQTRHIAKKSAVITMDYLKWHNEQRVKGFLELAAITNFAFHTGGVPECDKAIQVMQGCEPFMGLKKPGFRKFGPPVFVGHTNKDRKGFEGWCKNNGIVVVGNKRDNKFYREKLFKLCHSSIAVIGPQRVADGCTLHDTYGYCSNRLFVITGYAGCMLHQWFPGIENYFKPNEEILVWNNLEELLEQIAVLKQNPEKSVSIAEAGYKRARKEHTYENRTKKILKAVGL